MSNIDESVVIETQAIVDDTGEFCTDLVYALGELVDAIEKKEDTRIALQRAHALLDQSKKGPNPQLEELRKIRGSLARLKRGVP